MSLKISTVLDDEALASLTDDTESIAPRESSLTKPKVKKPKTLSKSQYRRLVLQGVIDEQETPPPD